MSISKSTTRATGAASKRIRSAVFVWRNVRNRDGTGHARALRAGAAHQLLGAVISDQLSV
jgi:hypothetical protein